MALAGDPDAAPAVQARAYRALSQLLERLGTPPDDPEVIAHHHWLGSEIRRFLNRPAPEASAPEPVRTPPGSPIGQGEIEQ